MSPANARVCRRRGGARVLLRLVILNYPHVLRLLGLNTCDQVAVSVVKELFKWRAAGSSRLQVEHLTSQSVIMRHKIKENKPS